MNFPALSRARLLAATAAVAACVATTLAGTVPAAAAGSSAGVAKSAPLNKLGVKIVKFAPGTSKAQMTAAVNAAGGEVVTDLSRMNRLGVYAPSASFDRAITAERGVRAVWTDRVVKLSEVDAATTAGAQATPQLGSPGTDSIPDPWHDLDSFLNENAPGVLQWDDDRNGARVAWPTTTGDHSVRVAVIDSGVDGSHKELLPNFDKQDSANTIPCSVLTLQYGPLGQMDCSTNDTYGHGTWVASRIAGAVNGFASNGIAPNVTIIGYKALSTTLGGGLTSWIVDAMLRACDAGADLINMSIGGYDRPGTDDQDYLMWVDAVNYCRSKGTAIVASAGNEHVRVNTVSATIGGRSLSGVGQVDSGDEGIGTVIPGSPLSDTDFRGMYETPAGVPGVVMVSATNNANGAPSSPAVLAHLSSTPTVGASDQLTYYSSYGDRIDIAAPGGARKMGIPRYDVGNEDVLYGGWGELGALTSNGELCQDPASGSLLTFACFKVNGAAFGWLQGTSMSAPNVTGVAALVLSAKHNLQGNPSGLASLLESTARTDMVNETGESKPGDHGVDASGTACTTGYCHLQYYPGGAGDPITFADAYGAGIVNAAAAVQ